MKISEILSSDRVTVSMEVFPPKTDANFETVERAVNGIIDLRPAFISCTYGAGGGTSAYTVKIAKQIKDGGVASMAHLTCVSSTKSDVKAQIEKIREAGIENILALRGDIPDGAAFPTADQFTHADELIGAIRELYPDACIGGACYPEKHPEAKDKNEDIKNLKRKVDAGCEFLTTQMFFENSIYYNYLYRMREAGITVPILAGIMPVTTKQQMKRSIELSGCTVPPRFKAMVDMFGDNPDAMKSVGILYASEQIVDLIANGITHIHIYTMNKPSVAAGILANLKEIL